MTRTKQLTSGGTGQELTPAQMQQMQMEGYLNLVREAATNPNIDPQKLKELLDLQDRVMERSAKQQYDAAMHIAQQEMSFIRTDARNPDKGNRYATYKALDKHIRPIYTSHGFSVSFDTGQGKSPEPIPEGHIRILMDIAHSGGHQVQKHLDIPLETTGAKGGQVMTRIHATGSAMSYGKRYLLIFGFNLAVGEEDDDGNKAGRASEERPRGGQDHRFKEPQPKSRSREDAPKGVESNPAMREKFPSIVRTSREADRVTASSLGTMRANMKRLKVPEERFEGDFGFPLAETHKNGLNSLIDWMKEVADA